VKFLRKQTNIDFLSHRRLPIIISSLAVIASIILVFFVKGLNFGLDFTGGTLIELGFNKPADISLLRKHLKDNGVKDAVVQHFGTARDVMIRLPVGDTKDSATLSNQVIKQIRSRFDEKLAESRPDQLQQCLIAKASKPADCQVQVRRVEFVGPQVGKELVNKGIWALLGSLAGILIYVMFRFEWRFAVGSIIATAHDVMLVFGFFSLTQLEFSLPVLAALLAILGYSLNDTIVVFDRIRENFRTMRKKSVLETMNTSLNQTLSRTIITSGTTLLVVLALYFFGGEIMRGFAIALTVGIFVGTYSSIYIASPAVMLLGITREDMMLVKKEGVEQKPGFIDY